MRTNQSTVLIGDKIILIPYKELHVPRYHEWMQSEELLEKTASERLSLDEEYQMQEKWLKDKDKCTFIVLSKEKWNDTKDEKESMVGDVNLFLTTKMTFQKLRLRCQCKRKRLWKGGYIDDDLLCSVVVTNLRALYRGISLKKSDGFLKLGLRIFIAKVGKKNIASVGMFHKLGFEKVSENSVFDEVTHQLSLTDDVQMGLLDQLSHVQESNYPLTVD